MIAFSYSFKDFNSAVISFIMILELEYCLEGDLVIIKISRPSGIRERIFNIINVLPEKLEPTKFVRLLL